MVQCAAFNCNVQSGQGVSMYLFPNDPKLRKIRTERLKRDNFEPSKHTKLCERHFENAAFAINPEVLKSVNFTPCKQKKLKPEASPTVFDFNTPKRKIEEPKKRKSLAHEKRRRLEVISELLSGTETDGYPPTPSPDSYHEDGEVSSPSIGHSATQSDLELHVTPQKESYSITTQTSYRLVDRRNVSIETDLCDCTKKLSSKSQETHEDPDWTPPTNEDDDEDDDDDDELKDDNPATEKKFIVFESCLDELFSRCCNCGSMCKNTKKVVGTYVQVTAMCDSCGEMRKWDSQPRSGTMPFGNLVLAGAIMFSGSSPSKVLTMLKHAAICATSLSTYMNIQSFYLVPTITSVWQNKQQQMFSFLRDCGRKIIVGGDGRCCSPGHTAKYGTYSLMDLKTSKILDIQLVQSNEVKNSYAMELEGLKRCLHRMEEENIAISHLVTDRHCQIKKFMKTEHPEVEHWFDCWHVAKGVFKKLEAAGKKKSSEVLSIWSRSISNHIYWCAMSSIGDGQLLLEKWLSILNHVRDIHEGHG